MKIDKITQVKYNLKTNVGLYGGIDITMRVVKNARQRKNEILKAAENLFLQKGYDETTVDDILKAVQLSKGGFYHHFQSKEEVLVHLIDQIMEQVIEEVKPIVQDDRLNAIEKLEKFFQRHIELKKEKVKLLAFFSDQHFRQTKWRQQDAFIKTYRPFLLAIIKQGINERSMTLSYPEETVDMLLLIFAYIREHIPQMLHDQKKVENYMGSVQELIQRSLGLKMVNLHLLDLFKDIN